MKGKNDESICVVVDPALNSWLLVNVISICVALLSEVNCCILIPDDVIRYTSQSLLDLFATHIKSLCVKALTSRFKKSLIVNAVCWTWFNCG